jgi:hypothetical protein
MGKLSSPLCDAMVYRSDARMRVRTDDAERNHSTMLGVKWPL